MPAHGVAPAAQLGAALSVVRNLVYTGAAFPIGVLASVHGVGDLFANGIVGAMCAHVSVTAGLVYAAVVSLAAAMLIRRVR
jgi:hypothetical protein